MEKKKLTLKEALTKIEDLQNSLNNERMLCEHYRKKCESFEEKINIINSIIKL